MRVGAHSDPGDGTRPIPGRMFASEWAATGKVSLAVPENFPTASQTSVVKK